ncbi:MAG: fibronectin type III domain-containing protein, partial [Anaerolineae bacterium]
MRRFRISQPPPTTGRWHCEYFNNQDCWWDPNCSRSPNYTEDIEGFIHKDWGGGAPPGIPADNWSARCRGTLNFSGASYVFHSDHDDGVKIFLDGSNIMDVGSAGNNYACPARYLSGSHQLQVNFREDGGNARLYVDWSTDDSPCRPVTCNIPSPSSPCGGARIPQTSNVNFSWSGNCSQYQVKYWGGPYSGEQYSPWVPGTSWSIGLWCGNYNWQVRGKSSGGADTDWSNTCSFSVVPATPTGLTATAVSSSQINLSWNDPGGEKDGYKVYYSNGNYVGSTTSTSYQVTGLSSNTEYCFYVKAYKGSLESD